MYDELVNSLRICGKMRSADDYCVAFHDGCCEAEPVCMYELMMKAADAIEELQQTAEHYHGCMNEWFEAAQEYKADVPKWIPVAERLPGEFGRYLCRYRVEEGETIGYCTDFGRYDPEHGEWFVGTVTHWMPLPPAPKEE